MFEQWLLAPLAMVTYGSAFAILIYFFVVYEAKTALETEILIVTSLAGMGVGKIADCLSILYLQTPPLPLTAFLRLLYAHVRARVPSPPYPPPTSSPPPTAPPGATRPTRP